MRLNKIYNIALTALVPGSALSAIIRPCPIAALVCGILAIAFAFEQHRIDKKKQAGNTMRILALEDKMETLKLTVSSFDDVVAKSDEIRSTLSSMKLSNAFTRK